MIGADAEEIKNDVIYTGEGILGNIIRQKTGQIVNDANNQPGSLTIQGNGGAALRAYYGRARHFAVEMSRVSCLFGDRTKAMNSLPPDLEFLTSLARQAAIAIQNASLFQETQKSESELRALFASMNDVIIVYDKDGRYVRIAPTNPSLLVRPPDEMVGKYIREVLPAELHDQFMRDDP